MSENYDTILAFLKTRIAYNHERYGLSYLDKDCTYEWLWKRLMGEVEELMEVYPHIKQKSIMEAMDVAIVALLIADKIIKSEGSI